MIDFKLKENSLRCIFKGRLATDVCQAIESEIDEQLSKNADRAVIFDLENVDYVASSFLRICIKTSKKLDYESFSIINVEPHVKKVFKISGCDNIMNIK